MAQQHKATPASIKTQLQSKPSVHLDVEQIRTVDEAEALLEAEEGELEQLKLALHTQQRRVELVRQRREFLAAEIVDGRSSHVSNSTRPASEYVISKDDDDEDVTQLSPTNGEQIDDYDDDFDTGLESIGVAKCGRCGAKLPLDLEAIDAHTVECERNFATGVRAPGKRSSGVHYLGAVKSSISAFMENANGASEEELFLIWLRKFHSEMSDEEFSENSEKLVEGFRAIWKEVWNVGGVTSSGGATSTDESRAAAAQSTHSKPLEPPHMSQMAPGVMLCTPKSEDSRG